MSVMLMDGQGRPSRLGDRVSLRAVPAETGKVAASWTTVTADENGIARFPYVGFGLPLEVKATWRYAKGTDDYLAAMVDDDRIVQSASVEPLAVGESTRDLHLTRESRPNEVWVRGRLDSTRPFNSLVIRLTHGRENSAWSTRIALDTEGNFAASVALDFARQPTLRLRVHGSGNSAEPSESKWLSFTYEELKQGTVDLGVLHLEER
jgi:hypothetical protein